MALVQKTKYIVWNEDWTGLAFKEVNDPTIDNFDYALPVTYSEKDPDKKAERLGGVSLNSQVMGRGPARTVGPI